MAHGPGKYDDICTVVRVTTQAEAVIMLVINGSRGSGFSVQMHSRAMEPTELARLLESTAEQIRGGAAQ